jgi:exodeoxyribonuclease VII small subunit
VATNVSDEAPEEDAAPFCFEEALSELEEIVTELDDGQVGLSAALARYEQGIKLLRQCYGELEGAERRIELVMRIDPQGVPVTEPFDDSPTLSGSPKAQTGGGEGQAARRSRRRTTEGTKGNGMGLSSAPEAGDSAPFV